MNRIYNEINAECGDRYKNLRFPRVEFGANKATVTVLCKASDREFVAAERAELARIIGEKCGFHTVAELKIDDTPPDAKSLRAAVVAFTEKFSYVSSTLHTITASTDGELVVRMKMHDSMLELARADYLPRLEEFLSNNYIDPVRVDISAVALTRGGMTEAKPNEYRLVDVKPIVGEFTGDRAAAIHTVTANGYNVAVCGVFAMPTEFVSKGGRKYEKFLLYDGEISVQCRYTGGEGFSVTDPELMGKTLCVVGNAEYDSVRGEANISVRAVSYCRAEGLNAAPIRKPAAKYERVIPKDYAEYVQSSMFDAKTDLPPALKGEFVVFDFETTGLSILDDRPTELGAVKIVDGEITQSFSTFIDPRKEIPPEVVEKTGITNEMVKGQPLFEDVLPDFHKFTYGCGLIGHNISFDFPFLIKGGNGCGWTFGDRRTFDTMGLAPLAVPGIQKLTLSNVLESLGLTNASAHRAWADAAATARAFVAMHRIIAEKKR